MKISSWFVFAIALLGTNVSAGDLIPPGPPAPTMKPLSEIEPRIPIRQEDIPLAITVDGGSYYLTESVTMTSASDAIAVSANRVTIDLNGFTINGPGPVYDRYTYGIQYYGSGGNNVTVKNGIVRYFPAGCIRLATGAIITNVHAVDSDFNAIVAGRDSIIENCVASRNHRYGILAAGVIRNCTVSENNTGGISIQTFTTLNGPTVVSGNTCSNNRTGISASANSGALIINNVCTNNYSSGIYCSTDANARVEGNSLIDNGTGIWLAGGNNIAIGNTARGNSNDFGFNANSTYGPIVLQDSGVITATNPFANIRY